jgi:hypothetical protein
MIVININLVMKQISLLLIILILFLSCGKTPVEPDSISVDLTIIATNSPTTQIQGQDIISNAKCSGSDLCYRFSKFEISETAIREFAIKAKATHPNCSKGDCVCLQAIYYADTSVNIKTATKGQYILRFYNNNLLFKADTVQVN